MRAQMRALAAVRTLRSTAYGRTGLEIAHPGSRLAVARRVWGNTARRGLFLMPQTAIFLAPVFMMRVLMQVSFLLVFWVLAAGPVRTFLKRQETAFTYPFCSI